jgi:pyruvate/2-oxoglutarate dehydrogenase complex dihydrolipoamide acyltransferase (E2) component
VIEVRFPVLSDNEPDAEGVVSTWLVIDGETVRAGQVIGEVMVDKVSSDIVAPADGVVRLLVAEEGTVVQRGLIARIE